MDASQIGQDLAFVRQAVGRREMGTPRPAAILVYWGVYVLIAFASIDWAPAISGWIFLGGTVAGLVFSAVMGHRAFARQGQIDQGMQIRNKLHWLGGMVVAIGVPIALAAVYRVPGPLVGQVSVILIGVVYMMAGIHIDRPFFWMGLLLIVGGVCVGLVPGYGWTALGVLLATGLFLAAARGNVARPMGAGRGGLKECAGGAGANAICGP